jgi:hypothetical protein
MHEVESRQPKRAPYPLQAPIPAARPGRRSGVLIARWGASRSLALALPRPSQRSHFCLEAELRPDRGIAPKHRS